MVEFAIALPVFLAILAGAYTIWTGLHAAIDLTSGARAGAITAANDIRAGQSANALKDARDAVNTEENTGKYGYGAGCTVNCVTMSWPAYGSRSATEIVIIRVDASIIPAVPIASGFHITTIAAAATK